MLAPFFFGQQVASIDSGELEQVDAVKIFTMVVKRLKIFGLVKNQATMLGCFARFESAGFRVRIPAAGM